MSDYDKLTVVKLRDELVKRGLPKTGLKAVLIQRLQEADARPGTEPFEPGKSERNDSGSFQGEGPTSTVIKPRSTSVNGASEAIDDVPSDGAPQVTSEVVEAEEKPETEGTSGLPHGEVSKVETEPLLRNGQLPAQVSPDVPTRQVLEENLSQSLQTKPESQHEVMPGVSTQPIQGSGPAPQLPTPSQTQSEQSIVAPALESEDSFEDSRKRKRRSESPPPSTYETQKRLKADNVKPRVHLPEDVQTEDNSAKDHVNGMAELNADHAPDPPAHVNGNTAEENGHASSMRESIPEGTDSTTDKQEALSSPQPKKDDSPIKSSLSDTRFKSLFAAPSKADQSLQQPLFPDIEERTISPALHPATSALYIRELMRPLKPESIRDHITNLATPADASVDSSVVTEFFLDSIRTHCLVGFANVSAASRVRSGLHDRIWPDERDRKPLFVDFVPEEKLRTWIDVEQNASSGRGQPQKRWEVVYEDEHDAIKAYLQEIGTNSGGLRAAPTAKPNSSQGVKGAPSGPKKKESESRASQAKTGKGKGFQALDDLFKSTAAKPKLYYQPVQEAIANKRLDKLATGRGGGRSDEMRRYTFEDDMLVDRAPEFGNRGRGGRRGFPGSYRGRGGAYMGDGYHGPGDSWRDRRFGY